MMGENTFLLPQHEALIEASAISADVASARGYRSVVRKSELRGLGFSDRQCRVPALLIPIWSPLGEIANYQIRPDVPRVNEEGKPVKYETPSKSRMVLDVPPPARLWIADPAIPLIITEGVRKADSAVSRGLCCIDALGVYSWRGTNEWGGKTVLPDWEHIALNGRRVHICFDSDVMLKSAVYQAMGRLKAFLEQRGVQVRLIYLQAGEAGCKVGLDDFFAQGYGVDDLIRLASSDLLAPPSLAIERDGADYAMTQDGIFWTRQSSSGTPPEQLTNFTARINAQVIEDDGADTSRLFEMEACVNGQCRRFLVKANQFTNLNWVIESLGANAVVYPGYNYRDHARTAIQLHSKDAPERHVFTHTGWRKIESRWVYLHAGGGISVDGALDAAEVNLPSALSAYRLPNPPVGSELATAVRKSLAILDVAPDTITVPLFCAIWSAMMGRSDFAVHLSGSTGAGKSELAALVQQHWGAGLDARHLPASWSSTGNALEGLAFAAKDAVLVVDDFLLVGSSTDAARLHREADRLLRAQGNSSGRQRMCTDSSLRAAKPPRGLIVSTGEDVPRGESLRARLVILEIRHGAVKWEVLSDCQKDASDGVYAAALSGFAHWLSPRYESFNAQCQDSLVTYRTRSATSTVHKRTPGNIARLSFGLQSFLSYAVDAEAISLHDAEVVWNRAWKALDAVAGIQTQHQAGSEPVLRFIEMLRGAIASGKSHVAALDGSAPENPEAWGWRESPSGVGEFAHPGWRPQGDRIGWTDGGDLYLEPEASYNAAQRFAREGGEELPLASKTLHKRLNERRLLSSTDRSRKTLTVRKHAQGSLRSVLHMQTGVIAPSESDKTDMTDHYGDQGASSVSDFPPFLCQITDSGGEKTDTKNCHRTGDSSVKGAACVSFVSSSDNNGDDWGVAL